MGRYIKRQLSESTCKICKVYRCDEGKIIAQEQVENKTNEIPVAQAVIESLDIEGAVITADALHTQEKTAEIIVKKKIFQPIDLVGQRLVRCVLQPACVSSL